MLFTQDRTRTREQYRRAWRKHLACDALEPLERQIVSLIKEHPEYHALMTTRDDVIDRDFTAADGAENPFLHLALHLALREQVGTDRPSGIATLTRSLLLANGNGHEVEHRMMQCLGECLWDAQRQGRAPDEAEYLERLRHLL